MPGGYLDFVYRVAAQELFGITIPPGPLPFKTLRNTDYREVVLEVDGRVVLCFALAYGFRNIQTLMRKAVIPKRFQQLTVGSSLPLGC